MLAAVGQNPVREPVPLDLAIARERQRVDNADLLGSAIAGEVLAAPLIASAVASPTMAVQTRVAPGFVGNAVDGNVGHARAVPQGRLHLGRVDVHPAGDDQVVAPSVQEQVAVTVEAPQISHGEGAACGQFPPGASSLLRLAEVLEARVLRGDAPDDPWRSPRAVIDLQRPSRPAPVRGCRAGPPTAIAPAGRELALRGTEELPYLLGRPGVNSPLEVGRTRGSGVGEHPVGRPRRPAGLTKQPLKVVGTAIATVGANSTMAADTRSVSNGPEDHPGTGHHGQHAEAKRRGMGGRQWLSTVSAASIETIVRPRRSSSREPYPPRQPPTRHPSSDQWCRT